MKYECYLSDELFIYIADVNCAALRDICHIIDIIICANTFQDSLDMTQGI